ncbi:MAG: fumarylacetoacetate hydrolase family protein [Acidimicrobiia bacterium]
MTLPDWDNAQVRQGLQRMLALRSKRLAGGEKAIGWKLAFGAPSSLARFGLSAPLFGFLAEATTLPPGSTVSCVGWGRPVAEPEIAVHIGRDVEPGSTRVAEAIAGIGAAIELADVHPPSEDIEEILAGNIFHRAVILGAAEPARAGGTRDGMRARVAQDGIEVANTSDLEALTGDLIEVVGHAAMLLAAAGERLRAGEVVITGSIVPPLAIQPGQEVVFELIPLPAISVRV